MSDPTKTSQTADILRYLRAGESLTSLQALDMFKCFRLAARIDDAKKRLEPNEQIVRQWVKTSGGARVARYSLKVISLQINLGDISAEQLEKFKQYWTNFATMTAINGNEIKDYNLIKPLPPEGQFFMHSPGVYCANCGELFDLYSFSYNQPGQVDANGKPFYSHCFKCWKEKP